MQEYWVNVFKFNVMGYKYKSQFDAIINIDWSNDPKPLYRIHVKMKSLKLKRPGFADKLDWMG